MSIFDLLKNGGNETIDKENMVLKVKTNRCPQNHPCPSVRVCPVGALTQRGHSAPDIDMEKCIKCGKCTRYCPMRALALE